MRLMMISFFFSVEWSSLSFNSKASSMRLMMVSFFSFFSSANLFSAAAYLALRTRGLRPSPFVSTTPDGRTGGVTTPARDGESRSLTVYSLVCCVVVGCIDCLLWFDCFPAEDLV